MTKRTKRILAMMSSKPKLRKISGLPPLTYTAKEEGTLKNYRIYGQTVDGESVGDRTGNLFDAEIEQGTFLSADGTELDSIYRVRSTFGNLINPGTYTISCSGEAKGVVIYIYDENKQYLKDQSKTEWRGIPRTFSIEQSAFVRFAFADTSSGETGDTHEITPNDIENIMLNEGYASLPYAPYGYKVPVTVSDGTDTLTTNLYLPEQIRKVGDEAEYIDYGEQKLHRVRKNLLPNTATSQTINGVTFTVNSDGSVTCNTDENGATAGTRFYLVGSGGTNFKKLNINANAIITGCPLGENHNTSYSLYILRKNDDMEPAYYNTLAETGNGRSLVYNETNKYIIFINISKGTICDNLTFYPMIRKADIEDDVYEPYIENTDVDVTLPALPTVTGTNVLSVGTVVQPGEVEVTGRIRPVPTGGGE